MPSDRQQIAGERFATVKEIDEFEPAREGIRGTFKVSDADFGALESQEVVRNLPEKEMAESFAEDFAAATQLHEERSGRAQTIDEQRRAETTTDLGQWASQPDRFDFPGVDTVEDRFDASNIDSGLF